MSKELHPYWATFGGKHRDGCIEAESSEAASVQAETLLGVKPEQCRLLPYPANPRISLEQSGCPSFCLTPSVCAGRSSCPRDYACSE